MSIIKSWAEYEYSDVIDCCGTVENVIKLYKFTHFHLDIEFVNDVQELLEKDAERGKTEVRSKVMAFNKEIGFELIPLDDEYTL